MLTRQAMERSNRLQTAGRGQCPPGKAWSMEHGAQRPRLINWRLEARTLLFVYCCYFALVLPWIWPTISIEWYQEAVLRKAENPPGPPKGTCVRTAKKSGMVLHLYACRNSSCIGSTCGSSITTLNAAIAVTYSQWWLKQL